MALNFLKSKEWKAKEVRDATAETEAQKAKIETQEKEEIDKIYENEKLLEFLRGYNDETSPEDLPPETRRKRLEAFQEKDIVEKDIKNLLVQEIQEDLDIRLHGAELDAVTKYVENMAIQNPGGLARLKEEMETFNEEKTELKKEEAELIKLLKGGRTIEEMQTVLDETERLDGPFGKLMRQDKIKLFYKMSEDDENAWKTLDSEYKQTREQLQTDIEKAETIQAQITAVKDSFEQHRKNFLNETFPHIQTIMAIAQKKMRDKLKGILEGSNDGQGLETSEKAQEYYDKIREAKERTEIDHTKGWDEDRLQDGIDENIERELRERLWDTIKPNETGTLSRLEGSLRKYLDKETVGSKKGDEAKQFVFDILTEYAGDTRTRIEKQWLLNKLLAKEQ